MKKVLEAIVQQLPWTEHVSDVEVVVGVEKISFIVDIRNRQLNYLGT